MDELGYDDIPHHQMGQEVPHTLNYSGDLEYDGHSLKDEAKAGAQGMIYDWSKNHPYIAGSILGAGALGAAAVASPAVAASLGVGATAAAMTETAAAVAPYAAAVAAPMGLGAVKGLFAPR